jgi:tetratricopeptide (TPR) repeat protein
MEMDQHDSAFSYFRKAVRLDPGYQNASLNLGKLYHKLGQYDSAIVHITNAIKLDPSKPKAYYELACSYNLNNKPKEAISYLKQAFERGYKSYENLIADPDLFGLKNYREFVELLDKYLPDRKD